MNPTAALLEVERRLARPDDPELAALIDASDAAQATRAWAVAIVRDVRSTAALAEDGAAT